MGLLRWQSNRFEDSIDTAVDFPLEPIGLLIVNDGELRVADPRIDQLFVEGARLVQ